MSTAALAAAVFLRWLLDPVMGDTLPLVTLFGAVAAAVWVGGYRPAVVVAVLGYLACDYLFIAPRGGLGLDDPGNAGRPGRVPLHLFPHHRLRRGDARWPRPGPTERRELLRVTLRSIGDAVITTDIEGRVTYLNAVAESLTGWTQAEAAGQPLDAVFRIVNEADPPAGREPRRQGPAGGQRRRPGEPHAADPQGRHGAPDRRQRRADPGRAAARSRAAS